MVFQKHSARLSRPFSFSWLRGPFSNGPLCMCFALCLPSPSSLSLWPGINSLPIKLWHISLPLVFNWKNELRWELPVTAGTAILLLVYDFCACVCWNKLIFVIAVWAIESEGHGAKQLCCTQSLSCVRLFAMPWTVALQAPLSMGVLQAWMLEWVAMPGDLPNPGIEPRSPELQADSLPSEPLGKSKNTGVGSLFLLQGFFLTQESRSPALQANSLPAELLGKPSCLRVWAKSYCNRSKIIFFNQEKKHNKLNKIQISKTILEFGAGTWPIHHPFHLLKGEGFFF